MDHRKYGTKIWSNSVLQINQLQSRYYLVDSNTGEQLNELINGEESLKKYYKGDLNLCVIKLLQKNISARRKEREYYNQKIEEQNNKIVDLINLIEITEKTNAS